MNTYMVTMKEVHERIVIVEALSEEEAITRAKENCFKEILLEPSGETYLRTLGSEDWTVELEKYNIEDCLLYTE